MTSYPVFFSIARPARFDRAQIAVRVVIFVILSIVGLTMGAVVALLYLALPAIAAMMLSQKGPSRFLAEDSPRLSRGLRWIMSAFAYMALLTDKPPMGEADDVRFEIEPSPWSPAGSPSVKTAILRLFYSLPSALVLCILMIASWFIWLVAALMILLTEDYPQALYDFQCGVLRFQARLFAYQASLVELYPPFALDVGAVARPDHHEPLPH